MVRKSKRIAAYKAKFLKGTVLGQKLKTKKAKKVSATIAPTVRGQKLKTKKAKKVAATIEPIHEPPAGRPKRVRKGVDRLGF